MKKENFNIININFAVTVCRLREAVQTQVQKSQLR